MTLEAGSLRRVRDNTPLVGQLPTTRVDALAAIGNPARFFATLTALGYQLEQSVPYADHHPFNQQELVNRFAERPLLMTEKDAVKCRTFALDNWWYLPVSAKLPDELLTALSASLKESHFGTRY